MNSVKKERKKLKDLNFKEKADALPNQMDDKSKRLFLASQEKGASSWLSALPIKNLGYSLTSVEFRNSLFVRYGWKIQGLPKHCACGKDFDLDHILTCMKGGFVTLRHNMLRDTEVKFLSEVCKDVKIEPELIPTSMSLKGSTADGDGAHPDLSARGVWLPCEKTFFDIMVTHPNAK